MRPIDAAMRITRYTTNTNEEAGAYRLTPASRSEDPLADR